MTTMNIHIIPDREFTELLLSLVHSLNSLNAVAPKPSGIASQIIDPEITDTPPENLDPDLDEKVSGHVARILECAALISRAPRREHQGFGIITSEDLLTAILITKTRSGSQSFSSSLLQKHGVTLESICAETGILFSALSEIASPTA